VPPEAAAIQGSGRIFNLSITTGDLWLTFPAKPGCGPCIILLFALSVIRRHRKKKGQSSVFAVNTDA